VNQASVTAVRRRLPSKGELTRQVILEAAADLASIEGLEGLSIGNLAKAVGMSKSGLYAHFGSKEELQLAVIETAREIVKREVVAPVLAMEPGLARLWALSERYISYNQNKVFPGGCFFGNVGSEVDARPGPLRDRIAQIYSGLVAHFVEAVRGAQAAGELDANADADQVGFELVAVIREASRLFLLDDNAGHFARARWAAVRRLRGLVTEKAPALPDVPVPQRKEAGAQG
jgi:AcrR family transcriptional regulator